MTAKMCMWLHYTCICSSKYCPNIYYIKDACTVATLWLSYTHVPASGRESQSAPHPSPVSS